MAVPPSSGSSPRSHDSFEGSPVDPSVFAAYAQPHLLTELFEVFKNSRDEEAKRIGKEGTTAKLQDLEVLDLSSCSLSEVPSALGLLTGLIELNLNNNQLKELPESLMALRQLRILKLERNHLECVPPVVRKMDLLGSLYLSENPIREIPVSMKDCLRSFPDQARYIN